MTNYPMHSPPETSGIYALKHRTTGQIYVGQSINLRRRYFEWRTVFATKLRATNHSLHGALVGTEPEDWEFIILAQVTPADLNRVEADTIGKLRAARPELCLNGTPETKPNLVVEPQEGSLALSEVLDESGAAMSHAQIASRLGVTKQAVKKRLAAWRRKGKNKITIKDLM